MNIHYIENRFLFLQLFENRTKYLKTHEREVWRDVNQELMSDEEDHEDGLKVKTPMWRGRQVSDLVKILDDRLKNSMAEQGKSVTKKRRVIAISPMKRKPSKKVKKHLIEQEIETESESVLESESEGDENEDGGDDNEGNGEYNEGEEEDEDYNNVKRV